MGEFLKEQYQRTRDERDDEFLESSGTWGRGLVVAVLVMLALWAVGTAVAAIVEWASKLWEAAR